MALRCTFRTEDEVHSLSFCFKGHRTEGITTFCFQAFCQKIDISFLTCIFGCIFFSVGYESFLNVFLHQNVSSRKTLTKWHLISRYIHTMIFILHDMNLENDIILYHFSSDNANDSGKAKRTFLGQVHWKRLRPR